MRDLTMLGADWLADEIEALPDRMTHETPSQYNERVRYLPSSVTSKPGYIRYAVNPYMREIVDCFDVNSPVREVNVMKGVQITYSTLLESGVLYFADYIGTLPMMYMTADKELAAARIENNYIPMFNHSDLAHIIKSSDETNPRKTGKTANHLQFAKGAYLVPYGANNAAKMRSFSIAIMLKDEIDAWPDTVGKDGDPDKLSDARTDGYSESKKIFRGSTPLIKGVSKIEKNYLKGDQRRYHVNCRGCGFPQHLRWRSINKENGIVGGFLWEMDGKTLVMDSVRYACVNCGHEHYEHDKTYLFSPDNGAKWVPSAKPNNPFIRSYHLPALYSPVGFKSWWECVADYLEAYDPHTNKVIDPGKYQVFYNNILASTYEVRGSRIKAQQVSAHRRHQYVMGQVPNEFAFQYCGSEVLFLVCTVDVHKSNLAVSVMGVCRNARMIQVDYWRFEVQKDEDDCQEISSPVWTRLRELIEEKVYTSDNGRKYPITITLIDAGYSQDTVSAFCSDYESNVYPILGRDRPAKNQRIAEFAPFHTQAGVAGFRILVDHYKDRMAPVLRREWDEDDGLQPTYHYNAPRDITAKQLKEFTVEVRKEKVSPTGAVTYYWDRPGNAPNELFDLLGYAYAAVEIYAWSICIQHFELETIEWDRFWDLMENNLVDA